MSNTGLVNGLIVNGIGASYFGGGTVITLKQTVNYIADEQIGIELRQNVIVTSPAGGGVNGITLRQDVVFRATSQVSADITLKQNVIYVTDVNNDMTLRQWVEVS